MTRNTAADVRSARLVKIVTATLLVVELPRTTAGTLRGHVRALRLFVDTDLYPEARGVADGLAAIVTECKDELGTYADTITKATDHLRAAL